MPKIDVEEQLKLRFLQPLSSCAPRRVVVWHDADGEFAPEFERLAAEGFDGVGADAGVMPAHGDFERPVRFVEACEGRMFAVKKLINRDDLASDILLYRRCPRGRLEGDWLADVECMPISSRLTIFRFWPISWASRISTPCARACEHTRRSLMPRPAALSLSHAFHMPRVHPISSSESLR